MPVPPNYKKSANSSNDWLSHGWLVVLALIISFSFLATWHLGKQIQIMDSYARMANISTAQSMCILEIGILSNVLVQTKEISDQTEIREKILSLAVSVGGHGNGANYGQGGS